MTNQELPDSARNLRRTQEQKLAEGWTDAAGRKHPPIDQAIAKLVAQLKEKK